MIVMITILRLFHYMVHFMAQLVRGYQVYSMIILTHRTIVGAIIGRQFTPPAPIQDGVIRSLSNNDGGTGTLL